MNKNATAIALALSHAGQTVTKKDSKMKATRKPRAVKPKANPPVPATPVAAATRSHLVPTGTISKQIGCAFFDPMDTLMDKLSTQPPLYSRVLESMAWMLDSACITQARNVLFGRYKEADKEIDNAFSIFCLDVHADLKHDSLYDLSVGEETPEHTLAVLLALRNGWHDQVNSAYAADDRDYDPKSLREQLESEKPQAVAIGTRVNLQLDAKLESRGDPEAEKRIYEAMLEAKKLDALSKAHSNRSLAPTILEILRTVAAYAPEGARFDHLPLVKQKQLTEFALGAIDRTKADLADRLKKQPIAFGRVAEAAFQAKEALNQVIRAKYHSLGELENTSSALSQVELTHQREQKRRAIAAID